jgi:hypothetical protein
MASRRVAACAAALALVTCVDADAPAFAVVRDPGAKGGNVGRLGPCGSARGGLAPKMVAGPQDEWTPAIGYVPKRQVSLEAGKVAQSPLVAASSGGAAYLEDLIKGVVDPTQPAQETVSREAAADAQRDNRPAPSKTATVVTRVIEMLVQKSQGQHDGSQKWAAPIGYVPRAAKAVHSPVLAAQVQELAKSASEPAQRAGDGRSCDPASSMPSKKWQPCGGHDPKDRSGKTWSPPTGYVPSGSSAASQVRSWKSPAGYVPGWASQMGDSAHEHVQTEAISSSATMSSAPAKKWEAYGGYELKHRRTASVELSTGASKPIQAYEPALSKPRSTSSPVRSSPAKKWEAYGGYVPKKLSAPTPSAAASSAPAQASAPVKTEARETSSTDTTLCSVPTKAWEPYGGYDLKNRGASVIHTTSAYQAPALAAKASIYSGPGSSMPAKKWEPLGGGYHSKTHTAPTPTAAVSNAPAQASAPVQEETRATWKSPAGYVPGWASQMGDSTRISPSTAGVTPSTAGVTQSTAGVAGGDALGRSLANQWESYGGYDPKKRGMPATIMRAHVQTRTISSSDTQSSTASKWEAYGGYVPKKLSTPTPSAAASSAPAQASAPVKSDTRATSLADTLSSAPAKKWTPPIGYVPRRQEESVASKLRSWKSPAGYVPGWTSQMGDFPGWTSPSTAGANAGDALSRSPAKKWEAYGDYAPKKLGAPTPSSAASRALAQASAPVKSEACATSSTDTLSSAPAKKWEPYGGYDPKNRGASVIRTAWASMAVQAYQPTAPAVKSSIVPGKKWESYGGYDPKDRKTLAAEVAPAASTRTVATPSSTTIPPSSSPAMKWEPYGGGYDPKNRGRPTPSVAGSASAAIPSPARSTVTLTWGDNVLAEFERSRSPSSPPRGVSPGRLVQVVILILK